MCGIKSAKLALRKKMKDIIAQLSAEAKQRQSVRVFEKVGNGQETIFFLMKNISPGGYVMNLFYNIIQNIRFYCAQLRSLPKFEESKRISVYLSTKDEIDTIQILKHMFETNKEVFVPRYKGKVLEMVKLLSMDDYEKLPLTKWNIKQPRFDEPRENALETGGLDLLVLPGVAFTMNGKRLGHGMGYYDRFLELCLKKQKKRPHLIAVAFNEQVWDDIPTSETDVLLDLVLKEK